MWGNYCERFHQVLEKKEEPLYLRIEVTDAFSFDVFLELRWSTSRNIPVLYHSTYGRRQIRHFEWQEYARTKKDTGRDMSTEEIMDAMPLWHFLRFQYIDKDVFATVKNAFEKAEGIDYTKPWSPSRDGGQVDLYSYIGKGAQFHYAFYLPQEYAYVTEAVSLLAEYLPLTDREHLQI